MDIIKKDAATKDLPMTEKLWNKIYVSAAILSMFYGMILGLLWSNNCKFNLACNEKGSKHVKQFRLVSLQNLKRILVFGGVVGAVFFVDKKILASKTNIIRNYIIKSVFYFLAILAYLVIYPRVFMLFNIHDRTDFIVWHT